jgi:hypothetical protein
MKLIVFVFGAILAAVSTASAQVELVSDNYFPAELEFSDLQKVQSQDTISDPALLSRIDDGRLFSDVGFEKCAKRIYSIGNSGSLSIEIFTLQDSRAAYSALTLLRDDAIQQGPPGDAFTATANGIRFAQGRRWIRIQERGAPQDLAKRVATSISNRIGPRRAKPPSLISHMPKLGCDQTTIRYYPGMKSFQSYSGINSTPFQLNPDMEIAQARYALDKYAGMLFLLSFPTREVAEDYFAGLTGTESGEKDTNKIYMKRIGPLVGILEGSFDPSAADKILGSIQYSYSVQWVYEKGKKQKTIWGIPQGILGTVVKSFVFVVLLCGISILAGAGYAFLRTMIRTKHSSNQAEEDEITQLRLR